MQITIVQCTVLVYYNYNNEVYTGYYNQYYSNVWCPWNFHGRRDQY